MQQSANTITRIVTTLALACALYACGGDSNTDAESGAQDDASQSDTGGDTSTAEPGQPVIGYFEFVAMAPSNGNPLVDAYCGVGTVATGQLAAYDATLYGYADSYTIEADHSDDGSLNGQFQIYNYVGGAITGSLDQTGGSGRWESFDSTCAGTWQATPVIYPTLATGEQLSLNEVPIPPVLRINFSPESSATHCTPWKGLIRTTTPISAVTQRVRFAGFAAADAAYRVDVELTLDTYSGVVEGDFSYPPLDIDGTLIGDAYYTGVPRSYQANGNSASSGCVGTWAINTVTASLAD